MICIVNFARAQGVVKFHEIRNVARWQSKSTHEERVTHIQRRGAMPKFKHSCKDGVSTVVPSYRLTDGEHFRHKCASDSLCSGQQGLYWNSTTYHSAPITWVVWFTSEEIEWHVRLFCVNESVHIYDL